MIYDTAIILAHELVKNDGKYKLSRETKSRTDLGIEYYRARKVKVLIMSGGHDDIGEKYDISLAEAMKQYAINQGIPEKDILKEDFSIETVGELVFCKIGIIDPKNWKKILIITNNWHLERTKKEAEFIFGKNYTLDCRAVPDFNQTKRTPEQEQASYNLFLQTFGQISPGNNEELLRNLLQKHVIYSRNPQYFKRKLKKLIVAMS